MITAMTVTVGARTFAVRAIFDPDRRDDERWLTRITETFPHRNESAEWEGDALGNPTAAYALGSGAAMIVETLDDEGEQAT